ncbi:hypothetical protein [uncultured Bacteroides sp.]|uniref:hypothetical protein n=1 Tax=uncultured Bacteroides sp. TaxID=162156 RepID=UPI002612B708|nr:hypothetical protein [uncultured Bacteroides sp.]
MKTKRTYGLLSLLFCSAFLPVAAQEIKENVRTEITAFFSDRLVGKETDYANARTLKLSEAEKYRDEVWLLWKEANNSFQEEKLATPATLSKETADRWHLPEELEPDAIMPFYWGRKGATDVPADGLPLFLYLHGSGAKEKEWENGIRLCSGFDDAPCLYFIPQIPNEGAYYRWWQKAKQFAWERLLRLALLSDEVNPDRLYVFGISEGGYGSQRLASFYADYWAAAGPMAGGEPLKNAPAENCGNLAFSLRTGAEDTGFYRDRLTGYTAAAFDSLQRLYPDRYNHWIELIPGKGHHIDNNPTTPWMKKYVRNPYPKHFLWEDYEMDGRHRKGFYNLYVNERPDNDLRTRYELDITGNNIVLNVDNVTYQTTETDPKWGIELKFAKSYTPAKRGKVTVYLNPELVDLSQKVTLTLNGKKVFEGKVKPDLRHLVNSCAIFFDPLRLYPAAIEVDLEGK